MGIEDRIRKLEASLLPPQAADTGARERLAARLLGLADRYRAHRERGGRPDLEGQSVASLVGLVLSYEPGEVPEEVADALREAAQRTSGAGASLALLCLEARGA